MEGTTPALVAAASSRAQVAGFRLSCEPAVGKLLAVLAAHLPAGAQVLELGTGAGVGTAWIVSGLLPRTDARVTSVEEDPQTAALAAGSDWPQFVDWDRVAEGGDSVHDHGVAVALTAPRS